MSSDNNVSRDQAVRQAIARINNPARSDNPALSSLDSAVSQSQADSLQQKVQQLSSQIAHRRRSLSQQIHYDFATEGAQDAKPNTKSKKAEPKAPAAAAESATVYSNTSASKNAPGPMLRASLTSVLAFEQQLLSKLEAKYQEIGSKLEAMIGKQGVDELRALV